MKKKLSSLFIVASLSLAVSLIIVACGAGDPELLVDFWERGDNNVSENIMTDNIDDIIKKSGPPPPPSSEQLVSSATPPEPSSAAPTPSSAAPTPSSAAPVSSAGGGNSSPATPSSSSAQKSSAAAVAGNCKVVKDNEKSGFTCGWDGYSASKVLTPGTILKPANATLPSGCTSVSWNYAPDTTGLAINYDCNALPAAGVSALGSSRYVLFAELTCSDGKHINACEPKAGWSSKKAPELSGKCVWDKNPPEVTSARGAVPSGVTVVDADGICGTTKSVVYKYDNQTKTWPSTGKLDEWTKWGKDKSEIYKVEAVLNCPAYSQTVAMSCPDLKVSGGVEHTIECTCGSSQCQVEANICKADGVAKTNKVTLATSECVEVTVYGYNNPHYMPEVGMRCASSNNADFVVSVNGKDQTVKGNGLVPIGKLKVEDETSLGTLCLKSGASPISCSGPGQ